MSDTYDDDIDDAVLKDVYDAAIESIGGIVEQLQEKHNNSYECFSSTILALIQVCVVRMANWKYEGMEINYGHISHKLIGNFAEEIDRAAAETN